MKFNKKFIAECREKKKLRKKGGGGVPEVDIFQWDKEGRVNCDDNYSFSEYHFFTIEWNVDEKSFAFWWQIKPWFHLILVIWGYRIEIG